MLVDCCWWLCVLRWIWTIDFVGGVELPFNECAGGWIMISFYWICWNCISFAWICVFCGWGFLNLVELCRSWLHSVECCRVVIHFGWLILNSLKVVQWLVAACLSLLDFAWLLWSVFDFNQFDRGVVVNISCLNCVQRGVCCGISLNRKCCCWMCYVITRFDNTWCCL